MSITIHNPILSGFHPDPSICRVGDDFYLVNSTFEYFPGIPIYHSTDLTHWEQLGHVLTRNSQVTLKKGAPNCIGIYAPTIRYHEGTFYCIVTNVGSEHGPGNFFVTSKNPAGEWSDPVYLDLEGIDPSLFFDTDGKMYYTGTDSSIYLCEIDPVTGARIGEKHYIWAGSGGNNPEGPHLYKINGIYYLMIAEGGTEACHMVTIARSEKLEGPYEGCPYNPVLTNRSTENPIKAVGHADLVEDARGDWWAVCLCNRPSGYPFTHNMGRETCLVPVEWKDGWPVMGEKDHVLEEMTVDREEFANSLTGLHYVPCSDVTDDFAGKKLHPSWNTIYNPTEGRIELDGKGLLLRGNAVPIREDEEKTILVRRQEHFDFLASVSLNTDGLKEDAEAGLTIYMNNRHHYEILVKQTEGRKYLAVRRQLGTMILEENPLPYEGSELTLTLQGDRNEYSLGYCREDGSIAILGRGEVRKLSTECGGCFTGNMIGIYATGADVRFTEFIYKSL